MKWYEVSPLKQTHARQHVLTYHSDQAFERGHIVTVPVGKTTVAAVVMSTVKRPSFNTKPVDRPITQIAIPDPILKLAVWLSTYYTTHPVQVWRTILPSGITKTRRPSKTSLVIPKRNSTTLS